MGRLGACFGVLQGWVGWGSDSRQTLTGIKGELHEKNHQIGISWPSPVQKGFITCNYAKWFIKMSGWEATRTPVVKSTFVAVYHVDKHIQTHLYKMPGCGSFSCRWHLMWPTSCTWNCRWCDFFFFMPAFFFPSASQRLHPSLAVFVWRMKS